MIRKKKTVKKTTAKSNHASLSNQPENDFPPGLSNPARQALALAGIQRLEQLTEFSESEINQLHGIGPNALGKLRFALDAKELAFNNKKGRTMNKTYIAKATITLNAPASKVWDALTRPELIKQYLFGTEVATDWQVGSPITYKGRWEGKAYEDKGKVLEVEPEKLLVSTFWSSLSGAPDIPENYQTVRYELATENGGTRLTIIQDNNDSEEGAKHSEQNWQMVLEGLKTLLDS